MDFVKIKPHRKHLQMSFVIHIIHMEVCSTAECCNIPYIFCSFPFQYHSAYTESDYYVGLYRTTTACSCRGYSHTTCDTCRASWSWYDGSAMNWWNWQDEEPNEFACGRISREGWAENECTEELKYICQRGKIFST